MEITEVRIKLMESAEDRLRGFCSITFDDCFVVRNIKVIEGRDNKLFVAMPSRRMPDGRYGDIAHPITRAFRHQMETTIIGAYLEEVERSGATVGEGDSSDRFSGGQHREGDDDPELGSSQAEGWTTPS